MTTILTKKKDTAGAPAPGDLTNAAGGAELAVNTATKRLYSKDSAGAIIEIGTNASSSTIDALTVTTSATLSYGTANQIQFLNASKILTGAAGLTWSGTALAVTGTVAVTGALTATLDSTFSSTGSLTVSKGTTGQRPGSPVSGMFRFNTTTAEFEGFNGTAFASVGGAALSNDTATASSLFPLFANATTGTAASVFTSNAQYLFKPSLGELSVKAVRASNGIFTNSATVSADATIASGDNGGSFGPTTINSGITLTISSGSVYTVV